MEVVMLEHYFRRPSTVDRIRENWLAPQIEHYVEWMHSQNYAAHNILRRVPLLSHFADFAREKGATDLASATSFVDRFAPHWVARANCKNAVTRRNLCDDIQSIVLQMLRLALEGRVTENRPPKRFLLQSEAPGFFQYLREERGFCEGIISRYLRYLNRFAVYLKRVGMISLSELSPPLLSSFVIDIAPGLARTTRRDLCGVVRTFLRYCYRERILTEDLSATFEIPQIYRLADVPRSITWDEVRRLLEVLDRRTTRGRRDYAILLMLVTYGLRACEVSRLTLDDVDWKNERLRIPERKAGHCTAYPLAGVVAEALIEYLKKGRPQTSDRHLFFRTIAPQAPITNGAVAASVAHYLKRAGVKVHRAGSHTLRHTCVQRLIDAEFPLKTIGDYVGHRSPQSTEIYTKVAIAALREVAMGEGEAL
jgi:integrase/recombinase XerD